MSKVIKTKVYTEEEILEGKCPVGAHTWTYALILNKQGEVILSEVYHLEAGFAFCPAAADILDEDEFTQMEIEDPNFYGGCTFEECSLAKLSSLFRVEEEDELNTK